LPRHRPMKMDSGQRGACTSAPRPARYDIHDI
jgi:hypothetical protein